MDKKYYDYTNEYMLKTFKRDQSGEMVHSRFISFASKPENLYSTIRKNMRAEEDEAGVWKVYQMVKFN